ALGVSGPDTGAAKGVSFSTCGDSSLVSASLCSLRTSARPRLLFGFLNGPRSPIVTNAYCLCLTTATTFVPKHGQMRAKWRRAEKGSRVSVALAGSLCGGTGQDERGSSEPVCGDAVSRQRRGRVAGTDRNPDVDGWQTCRRKTNLAVPVG